ncbi:MAG: hypothetical protein BWX81_00454 [Spirochaetes bacterium ADurb.Bin110]|nr:MAG: hypothetical protein BWX81_00454 [Spirochaetes bacterium ADurb.Bin110]
MKTISSKTKAWRFKNCFLNPCNKPESKILADFANFAKKIEVEDKIMIFTGSQIIKKLIHNKEIAFIWIGLFKCCHHIFKCILIVGCRRHFGKSERNTNFFEVVRNRIADNIMQIHCRCAYFKAAYLKTACNGSCLFSKLIVM